MQSKNRKRKIDVTVNVNINDKSMKKSEVVPKPDPSAEKRSQIVNKFMNHHKAHGKARGSDQEEDEDDNDDGEDNDDDVDEETGKKHIINNKITSHRQSKPKISTVTDGKPHKSIFSSMKELKKNAKNYPKISDDDDEREEDADEDEGDDEDESGSGDEEDEEDDVPSASHLRLAEKAKHALEHLKHSPAKKSQFKLSSKNSKHHYSDKETAQAEEGETASSNVKANKLAARLEQKQNELEHNDEMLEPLTNFHTKAKKMLNKEEAEEVRLTTESSAPSELKNAGHEAFIHNVKSGNSKSAKAEDVRIEQLSGKSGAEVNSQPIPEVPGNNIFIIKRRLFHTSNRICQ